MEEDLEVDFEGEPKGDLRGQVQVRYRHGYSNKKDVTRVASPVTEACVNRASLPFCIRNF